MELEVGAIVDGKVKTITKFGAFVAIPGGKTGMVHISEVAHAYVNDIHDHLQEGQDVKVMVIGIDPAGKINLSIKRTLPPPQRPQRSDAPRFGGNAGGSSGGSRVNGRAGPYHAAPREPAPQTFEDKLKAFMAESDSKIASSKQYADHKTRSRRK